MAFQEKLSVPSFRQGEQGLICHSLQQQVPIFALGEVLAQNFKAVQQVRAELGLMKPGAPFPILDDAPLRQALAGKGLGSSTALSTL